MWQAEVRVDLDAVRANVARLRAATPAQVMAVVKADGYRHGMVPCARAALEAGATWLGVATLDEALALRAAGITAPVLSWLHAPGTDFAAAITAGVDVSVSARGSLDEIVAAAAAVDRPARIHLKIDSGMGRGGAAPADWPALVEAAAKAQADGRVEIIGGWSHLACADDPDPGSVDRQLAAFTDGLATAARLGVTPQLRHLANSAALLTRPDTHFDLVRPGLAVYGLSPIDGDTYDLRPAMSVRARVALVKRLPAGQGVSYGQTYVTPRETTVALIPIGYADGVPRAAGDVGPVALGGRTHRVAGRVCMDQFVLDVGDLPVQPGDVAVLFGGGAGDPHADEWARVCGTINHEIVARMGSARVPRVYEGERGS